MAGSINKVILVGNLGADPEIRDLPSGQKVANLRVATSEYWSEKSTGDRRERTEWHTVNVFNQNAVGFAESYLKKGSKVYIEGQLKTRKWQDQTDQDRYSTEVVVNAFGGQLIGLSSNIPQDSQGAKTQKSPGTSATDFLNDDIPF